MDFQHKVGFKIILIFLFSLVLALSAVLVVAESLISQQVHKRHQKRLDTLTEKVFFSLEKQKDQIRLLATAVANFGRMGPLVAGGDQGNIRNLVDPVFQESGLDVLFVLGQKGRELVRLQSDQFRELGPGGSSLIKKAILGIYGVRLSKWEHGIFVSGSSPIYNEQEITGRVYAGVLLNKSYLDTLAKGMDSFMAIVREGNVIAATFTKQEGKEDELEFSEEVLHDIKALVGQSLPVVVEEKLYTMKSLPLRDRASNIIGYLVIGLSRGELNQTVSSLRWTILGAGGGGALLGGLLMIFLTSRMRRQIALLSIGTERVTSGNLTETIPEITKDELGVLARSFNQMALTLEERDQVLKEEKEKILANVDFLSMMVHDIKAPMAGLSLMIETLLEENLSREVKQRLAGMGESIEEILGHLYNVLTISKIEKGPFTLHLEPVDLNASVAFVRSQCQVVADRKEIRILEDLAPDLPALRADEFYLERLIYNLLINAIHWAPQVGCITLKTAHQQEGESRTITLEVADNGPGISPEQKPHLFKKYISRPEKGDLPGTHSGLGLHISQSIIQALGGTLLEAGIPGVGARFICTFPVVEKGV
ncbi:MAG: HAMP domain-containing protein [Deltaproteobacteria bacterium]|nr:HAMP domain-containing protein [Deltaproteobacteria bacterium]